MALIQTSLIWVAYGVAVAILIIIAALFVYMYQQPRDRAVSVSTVCILTVSALLATILLLPVDVALVSSTVSSKTGLRKDWAGQKQVDSIVLGLKIVYYALYSLDALLCLLAIPFTYFFYEEYDENEAAEGSQSFGSRLWGATKYTLVFVVLCVALFLVGFFLPVAAMGEGEHRDLDYFKRLLTENRGERALTFAIGLLLSIGTQIYVLYTATGLALIPIIFIRSAPSVSAPDLAATTQSELEQNRERQRQLEGRNEGAQDGLDARDRRELEALVREERTLVRRERIAAETKGEGHHWLMRVWMKTEAVFRPLKLVGGILLLLVGLVVFASMLITGIDKAKNSVCGAQCGYVLGQINVFQPVNYILVQSAKVFPIDYVLFLLLVLLFFSASVVGIASVGIRFLWISLFSIRKGKTSPQAMLIATELLALMVFAINYAMAMIVAPQYSTWGPQAYCDSASGDCASKPELIKPCTELAENKRAGAICTPSVVSTFINRTTVNFPFFGPLAFYAQFPFLALYLVVLITAFIRTPKVSAGELDNDLEEEEEEGLLAATGRRFEATWHDITGRARANNPSNYGATGGNA